MSDPATPFDPCAYRDVLEPWLVHAEQEIRNMEEDRWFVPMLCALGGLVVILVALLIPGLGGVIPAIVCLVITIFILVALLLNRMQRSSLGARKAAVEAMEGWIKNCPKKGKARPSDPARYNADIDLLLKSLRLSHIKNFTQLRKAVEQAPNDE